MCNFAWLQLSVCMRKHARALVSRMLFPTDLPENQTAGQSNHSLAVQNLYAVRARRHRHQRGANNVSINDTEMKLDVVCCCCESRVACVTRACVWLAPRAISGAIKNRQHTPPTAGVCCDAIADASVLYVHWAKVSHSCSPEILRSTWRPP